MDLSDNKDCYEIDHISKNGKEQWSDVVENLKVRKFSSHKYVDNVET